jgi:7-cyano-7-deazaguanine reductase
MGEPLQVKYGTEEINNAALVFELWDNPSQDQDYSIHLEHPEFSALCPRSGYPDSGIIIVDYSPNLKVIELKSFKLFINSYRNVSISHESVATEIYRKLKTALKPKYLRVIGDFMRRGGVKTVITVGDRKAFEPYQATLL